MGWHEEDNVLLINNLFSLFGHISLEISLGIVEGTIHRGYNTAWWIQIVFYSATLNDLEYITADNNNGRLKRIKKVCQLFVLHTLDA
jgi:hypothetical protein